MNRREYSTNPGAVMRILLSFLALITFLASPCTGVTEAWAAGGDILWQRQDAQAGKQEARRSVVDSDGSVFVTGYRNLNQPGNPNNDDYWTVKFTADGSGINGAAWNKYVDKSGGSDQANAIALDKDHNIIVTGYVMSGTNKDIHTVKYNGATGAVIWQHTYNGAGNGMDSANAVTTDVMTGEVFVAGYTQNINGNLDCIVISYPYLTEPGTNLPNWSATYGYDPPGEPPPGDDIAEAVAAAGGKVVITGRSGNSTDYDMLTIRYDIAGGTSWEKRQVGTGSQEESGREVRFDSAGNVVVSGVTANTHDKDIYTAKYAASDGSLLWEQTYNGAYNDEPAGLMVAADDEVYVTGYTWSLEANNDYFTARYDGTTGIPVWQKTFNSYNGTHDIASPTGIVVDTYGDIFVTGYTISGSNESYQTVKYRKSDGTELWQNQLDVSPGRADRPVGIGLDPAGNVKVAGWADSGTTGLDYHLVTYDPGLLNPPTSLQTQVAVDNSSVTLTWAYVDSEQTGYIVQRCSGWECTNFADVTITPLPPADRSWVDTAVDPDTFYYYRVMAIKETEPTNTSYPSNTARALTQYVAYVSSPPRYDINSEFAGDDLAKGIAVGPDNNPVITGYSDSREMNEIPGSGGGLDYLTMKFDRSLVGQPLWSSRYDSDQNGVDKPACIVVNSSNEVLVAGLSELFYAPAGGNINSIFTMKYPATGGDPLWGDQFNGPGGIDDRATAIASSLDANNNVAVVGYGKNAQNNNDIYLIKYTSAGVRAWAPKIINKYGYEDLPSAVAFDSSGNIFITGTIHNGTNFDIYTAKYNGTNGVLIWDNIYNGAANGNDQGLALAVDPAGNPYVTGYVATTANGRDFYTIKYDGANSSSQRVIWEKSYNGPANGNDWGVAIAVDPFDGSTVTVAGTSRTRNEDDDFRIIRYTAGGTEIWSKTILRPETDDELKGMATDLSGNVFIAGTSTDWTNTFALAFSINNAGAIAKGMTVPGPGVAETLSEAYGIAVNRYGEAFVAGYSENEDLNADFLLFKMQEVAPLQPPYPLAASPAATSITLSWGENSLAEDGYKVFRKDEACNLSTLSFSQIASLPPDSSSYIDNTVIVTTSYCYRVAAFKGTEEKSSPNVTVTTTTIAPDPLTLAANADQTQITLTWTDVPGETGYRVERKVGAAGTWTFLVDKAANVSTHTDTGLTATTFYYYRVKALNGGGYSANTTEQSIPLRPTTLTAAVAAYYQINLSWTDLSTETSYILERKAGAAGAWGVVNGNISQNTIAYNNSGLYSGTLYYYRLQGRNSSGTSGYSPEASGTTLLQAPAITSAAPKDGATDRITLNWTDPNVPPNGNETNNQMDYSLCTNTAQDECANVNAAYWSGWTVGPSFPANSTSGDVTGLAAGRTYKFRGQGRLVGADSGYSNTDKYTTVRMLTVGAPTVSNITNSSVTLTWNDIAGENNYDIIQNEVRKNLILPKNTTTSTSSYTVTGLQPATNYTFRIYAYNSVPDSTTSAATPVTTTIDPTQLTSVAPASATSIKIDWNDAIVEEAGYEVQRTTLVNPQENPANPPSGWNAWTTITAPAANVLTYTDSTPALTAGSTYRYRVRFKLADNSFSAYSNELYTTLAPPAPTVSVSNGVINWTDVPGESGYYLYQKARVSDCATDSWSAVTPTTITPPTYSHTPANPASVYCYRVEAFNSAGTSGATTITYLQATTVNTPLPSPDITPTTIKVVWQSVTDATGYSVQWSSNSAFTPLNGTYTAAAGSTSYIIPGLSYGTTYYIRVQALSGSNSFFFGTTQAITIPAIPSPGATPASLTSLTVSWAAVGGATGYRYQYKQKQPADDCNLGSFWTGVSEITQSATSVTLTPLITGAAYCYRVKSYNGSGDSLLSVPGVQTTLLATPTMTIASVTPGRVCLSWNDVAADEGYRVQRSLNNVSWTVPGDYAKDSISGCDTTVLAGTLYYYRVSPKDIVGGLSTASNVLFTTTTPPPPQTLTTTPVSHTRIDLAWSSSLSATKYQVERKVGGGAWGYVGETSTLSYQDTGPLDKGTEYTYRVMSYNPTGGYSLPSLEASATTLTVGNMTITSATPQNPTRVELAWAYDGPVCNPDCTEPDGFELEIRFATGRWLPIATFSQGTTSYINDCGLRPNKTYEYRIRSFRGSERSPYSPVQSVTTHPYAQTICSYGPNEANHTPTITSTPVASAVVGTLYSYQVTVTDPYAGDNFLYTLLTAPAGMTVSSAGLITWTPTQSGTTPVLLRVGDIVGNSVEQDFTINVSN